ncbi:MAG: hypothetical protein VX100_17070 [Pseudomonadota bacterium]|nr:hypothetical protein [Pseudomonadota bacterium]
MRFSRYFNVSILALMLIIVGCGESYQALRDREAKEQQNWPKWPEFESAVPKPDWWHSVPIKYIDPMNFTSEEMTAYYKKNTGDDKYKRDFKVIYARMLKHQNNAQEIAGFLGRGTVSEFKPFYEFYITHFLDETWQSEYCEQCNDANSAINIGTQWLYYLTEGGEYERAQKIIDQLLESKYPRAIPMQRFYLIRSYRRLLAKTVTEKEIYNQLEPYIVENYKLAEQKQDYKLMQRWLDL